MFIVWRKRPVKGTGGGPFLTDISIPSGDRDNWKPMACHHRGGGRDAWTPLLVVAERVGGKPRQRVLHRFPTIRTCCIEDPLNRAAWWHDVLFYLDHVDETWCEEATFLPRDRPDIMAKLRELVPDPTVAGRKLFKEYRARKEREAKAREKAAANWWKKEGPGRKDRYRPPLLGSPPPSPEEARRRAEEKQRQAQEDYRRAEEAFRRTVEENPDAWRHLEDLLRQMKGAPTSDDAYRTLGLQAGATAEQVKAAYRKLAMTHHPDKGGSAETFNKIKAAHDLAMRLAPRASA